MKKAYRRYKQTGDMQDLNNEIIL